MGKKRKHEKDHEETEEDVVPKRTRTEADLNVTQTNGNHNSSNYEVYLIKKPLNVSLQDLESLKWSGDEEVLSKSKLKTDNGSFRAVVAPFQKQRRMVHIPAIREITKDDRKNISAAGFVNGTVLVLPTEVKQKYLGGSIYEEGEEPAEDAVIHKNLMKIKKTAVLELEGRQQRNKAYGTETTSDGKPRKLPNLVSKKKKK